MCRTHRHCSLVRLVRGWRVWPEPRRTGLCVSVAHFPVCYRFFDCSDSFSGWYGMVVLQVVFDCLIFCAAFDRLITILSPRRLCRLSPSPRYQPVQNQKQRYIPCVSLSISGTSLYGTHELKSIPDAVRDSENLIHDDIDPLHSISINKRVSYGVRPKVSPRARAAAHAQP